jgi:hypothetical protein
MLKKTFFALAVMISSSLAAEAVEVKSGKTVFVYGARMGCGSKLPSKVSVTETISVSPKLGKVVVGEGISRKSNTCGKSVMMRKVTFVAPKVTVKTVVTVQVFGESIPVTIVP